MKEQIIPPCLGFYLVFGAINRIDPRYFTQPPPRSGVKLVVVGTDKIRCEWLMTPSMANAVVKQIRGHMSIKDLATMEYKDA